MFVLCWVNERVKLGYCEIRLNVCGGERLCEGNWINVCKEYMEKMGYGKCC